MEDETTRLNMAEVVEEVFDKKNVLAHHEFMVSHLYFHLKRIVFLFGLILPMMVFVVARLVAAVEPFIFIALIMTMLAVAGYALYIYVRLRYGGHEVPKPTTEASQEQIIAACREQQSRISKFLIETIGEEIRSTGGALTILWYLWPTNTNKVFFVCLYVLVWLTMSAIIAVSWHYIEAKRRLQLEKHRKQYNFPLIIVA